MGVQGTDVLAIAGALARIPQLQSEPGCATFVRMIGRNLDQPLLVPMLPDIKSYLYHVVEMCDAQERGLLCLLQIVDYLAAGTPPAAEIRRLVSPLAPILPPDEENVIRELLEGRIARNLTRLFHRAVVGGATLPLARPTDAWEAYSLLLDANIPSSGLPSHVLFVELLVRLIQQEGDLVASASIGDRLRRWVNQQVDRLLKDGNTEAGHQLTAIRNSPDWLVNRSDSPLLLIIQLEPVLTTPDAQDLYRLSHWRQFDPIVWRPQRGKDRLISLQEVAKQVMFLIQEIEEEWAHEYDDNLVLQFVVPHELMNLDFDQWELEVDGFPPAPLGAEYEIIVRSHDRMRQRTLHRRWRMRWKTLMERATECEIHFVPLGDSCDISMLWGDLLDAERVVACVLSSPPDRDPGRTQLDVAVRIGLPIAIWCREEEDNRALHQIMRDALEISTLDKLPAEVKKLRLRGMGQDVSTRACRSITLLWDDPNCIPEDSRPFRAPQRDATIPDTGQALASGSSTEDA